MQPSTSCVRVRVLVVLGLMCGAGVASAAPDWARYRYFKEERLLELDPSRLAILDRGSISTTRLAEFLRDAGLPPSELELHPMPGWSFFALGDASGTEALDRTANANESVPDLIGRLVSLDRDARYFFSPVFRGELGPIVPTQTVLVRFDERLSEAEVREVLAKEGLGAAPLEPFGKRNLFKVRPQVGSGVELLAAANRLAVRPEVVAAEPDMIVSGRSAYVPSDPYFPVSWGHHNTGQFSGIPDMDIDAPEAWEWTKGSPAVKIVIFDTGVQQNHPDLHQLPGMDFTGQGGGGGPVSMCDRHGTPVAGIIGSTMDNGLGTAGVAAEAWIVSARTFTEDVDPPGCGPGWSASISWSVDALNWAESIGARVTNNSNGYPFTSSVFALRYEETRAAGMVHFASAGNNGIRNLWYPSLLPSVNAIAAIQPTGTRASFSNFGPGMAFTGPGQNLFATDRTGSAGWVAGDYGSDFWGTSFSSPMIAGVAALLISHAPSLDADQVEELLKVCSVDLGAAGWDEVYGWGLPKAGCGMEAIEVFSDGFESGDVSRWSEVMP
jgi:hypothetical protein